MGNFFSNIVAVAYKEASILRHDKALIATIFIQPIIMLLLFGGALSNKPANVPWVVLDQSHTGMSRRLLEEIESTGYFVPPRAVSSYDQGKAELKHGRALAFVVIPAGLRRQAADQSARAACVRPGAR